MARAHSNRRLAPAAAETWSLRRNLARGARWCARLVISHARITPTLDVSRNRLVPARATTEPPTSPHDAPLRGWGAPSARRLVSRTAQVAARRRIA